MAKEVANKGFLFGLRGGRTAIVVFITYTGFFIGLGIMFAFIPILGTEILVAGSVYVGLAFATLMALYVLITGKERFSYAAGIVSGIVFASVLPLFQIIASDHGLDGAGFKIFAVIALLCMLPGMAAAALDQLRCRRTPQ